MKRSLILAVLHVAGLALPADAAENWRPRVTSSVLCLDIYGEYSIVWDVVNTHPRRNMRVLSTSRPLIELLPGDTAGTLTQTARVRWRWRADGETHVVRGRASKSITLAGDCEIDTPPVITVAVTGTGTNAAYVTWGTIDGDSSGTFSLPWSATVSVNQVGFDVASMLAQEDTGSPAAHLDCYMYADGVVIEHTTADGAYAICSVSHSFEDGEP